jgi:phosphoserine phosphatase
MALACASTAALGLLGRLSPRESTTGDADFSVGNDLAFLGVAAVGKTDSVETVKGLLPKVDAFFFDVDSTVVTTEGIDLLGKCFGVMKEISELTHKAMNGNVKFQDAMAERLQLMADHGMTRDRLDACVATEGKPQWSPGVQEFVRRLHSQGTDVYLVSGGFANMLKPIAFDLHIPTSMVYANTILFNDDGTYAGFDRNAPTSASGGKPKVLTMMKRKKGYKTMIMMGDGATDLDARVNGPATAFIGYGGVAAREKVIAGADWFVYSFDELLEALPAP